MYIIPGTPRFKFPDFSVSDPWGMKTKQFVIRQAMEGEAEEQDGDKDQMELVIASDLQGFTMEQEGGINTDISFSLLMRCAFYEIPVYS